MKSIIKSICKKNWITKNEKLIFVKDKIYTHLKSSELALIGENGCVMFMSDKYYVEFFISTENQF